MENKYPYNPPPHSNPLDLAGSSGFCWCFRAQHDAWRRAQGKAECLGQVLTDPTKPAEPSGRSALASSAQGPPRTCSTGAGGTCPQSSACSPGTRAVILGPEGQTKEGGGEIINRCRNDLFTDLCSDYFLPTNPGTGCVPWQPQIFGKRRTSS